LGSWDFLLHPSIAFLQEKLFHLVRRGSVKSQSSSPSSKEVSTQRCQWILCGGSELLTQVAATKRTPHGLHTGKYTFLPAISSVAFKFPFQSGSRKKV
jgi:hypothetical protein